MVMNEVNPVKQPCEGQNDPEKQPSRKQIVFNIHPTLHTELKIRATERNISMRTYIMKAILEQIRREKEFE